MPAAPLSVSTEQLKTLLTTAFDRAVEDFINSPKTTSLKIHVESATGLAGVTFKALDKKKGPEYVDVLLIVGMEAVNLGRVEPFIQKAAAKALGGATFTRETQEFLLAAAQPNPSISARSTLQTKAARYLLAEPVVLTIESRLNRERLFLAQMALQLPEVASNFATWLTQHGRVPELARAVKALKPTYKEAFIPKPELRQLICRLAAEQSEGVLPRLTATRQFLAAQALLWTEEE